MPTCCTLEILDHRAVALALVLQWAAYFALFTHVKTCLRMNSIAHCFLSPSTFLLLLSLSVARHNSSKAMSKEQQHFALMHPLSLNRGEHANAPSDEHSHIYTVHKRGETLDKDSPPVQSGRIAVTVLADTHPSSSRTLHADQPVETEQSAHLLTSVSSSPSAIIGSDNYAPLDEQSLRTITHSSAEGPHPQESSSEMIDTPRRIQICFDESQGDSSHVADPTPPSKQSHPLIIPCNCLTSPETITEPNESTIPANERPAITPWSQAAVDNASSLPYCRPHSRPASARSNATLLRRSLSASHMTRSAPSLQKSLHIRQLSQRLQRLPSTSALKDVSKVRKQFSKCQ